MKEHERMIRFICEDCNYNMLMGEDDSGTRFYCPRVILFWMSN